MLIYLSMIETEEDKRKFEEIYLTYRKTMFFAANRILKDEHLSEDVVHLAFMRIIDHLEKIDESDCHKTKAFLVVIAEHIAIDFYRKNKKHNTISYDEAEIYIQDYQSYESSNGNPIIAAIASLPVNYSLVLRLKYSQGYSDSEISEILNISTDNVRQRISRGKKKLAEILEKGEYDNWQKE